VAKPFVQNVILEASTLQFSSTTAPTRHKWLLPLCNSGVTGVDEELRWKLLDGVPDLLGRVDLLLENHDTVSVVDFKTARSAWTPDQANDNSEQLFL
jgi:hypothetical protein